MKPLWMCSLEERLLLYINEFAEEISRAFPDLTYEDMGESYLEFIDGNGSQVRFGVLRVLEAVWELRINNRWTRRRLYRRHLDNLSGMWGIDGPEQAMEKWGTLYPRLQPASYLRKINPQFEDQVPCRHWQQEWWLTLAFHKPKTYLTLTDDSLAALNLDFESCLELAMGNLREIFPREEFDEIFPFLDTSVAYRFGDGLAAERLLLFPKYLPEEGEIGAFVPNDCEFTLFQAPSDNNWNTARDVAQRIAMGKLWRPLRINSTGITMM